MKGIRQSPTVLRTEAHGQVGRERSTHEPPPHQEVAATQVVLVGYIEGLGFLVRYTVLA